MPYVIVEGFLDGRHTYEYNSLPKGHEVVNNVPSSTRPNVMKPSSNKNNYTSVSGLKGSEVNTYLRKNTNMFQITIDVYIYIYIYI